MSILDLSHLSKSLIHLSSIILVSRQKVRPSQTVMKTRYLENPFMYSNCFISNPSMVWSSLYVCAVGVKKVQREHSVLFISNCRFSLPSLSIRSCLRDVEQASYSSVLAPAYAIGKVPFSDH